MVSSTNQSPARLAWTVAILLAAGNGLLLWDRYAPIPATASPSADPIRFRVRLPADVTVELGRGSAVAIAPDGRAIVFRAAAQGVSQLYLQAQQRFDATPLAGTEGGADPFFSVDGRSIGFFAGGLTMTWLIYPLLF